MTRAKRKPLQLGEILGASAELLKSSGGQTVATTRLKPGQGQPRREFDPAKLEELARSIQEKGILQPLLVRPAGEGYEIVAGERRWRAAQLAQLAEVPVVIRELTDSEARQIALIENLQREDLNLLDEVDAKLALVSETLQLPADQAKARLMQLLRQSEGEEHLALTQAFGSLGENWSTFARGKLRVLSWPAPILAAVRTGLPFSLGAVIAGAPEEHQTALLKLADKGASRTELQAELKRLSAPVKARLSTSAQVGRLLTNHKWLGQLPQKDQNAIESWLGKMPTALKSALEE
ncbi:ParB/RepB/Spo0J family partition protein [Deinococcus fonticola]|uniref:ParB/RepB/Spo0J family partition protein n=1 Tax=Deinococcus fonticola TaxID=2528713 RepID=UPI00107522D7|nr:ParB/RepB/Spo0J family partition protein [Deinococcus fonticola]